MLLQVYPQQIRTVEHLFENWQLWYFVSALVILAALRANFPNHLRFTYKALFNIRFARQILREGMGGNQLPNLLSLVFSFITLGVFTFYCQEIFKTDWVDFDGISAVIFYSLLFATAYAVKWFGMVLSRIILHGDYGLREYQFQVGLVVRALGVFCFVPVLLMGFVPLNIAKGLAVFVLVSCVVFLIFRVFRGVSTCFSYRVSPFYIFLYLCALEILPILLAAKFAS